MAKAGFPVVCIETRHTKAFLEALQQNKSDRNDARGIANMMRVGLFKDVHVKTLGSQKRRALLTARSLLQEKAIDLENEMRGLLRNFGLKVGQTSGGTFERRILELIENDAELVEIMQPLLDGRRKLREGLAKLEKRVRMRSELDKTSLADLAQGGRPEEFENLVADWFRDRTSARETARVTALREGRRSPR